MEANIFPKSPGTHLGSYLPSTVMPNILQTYLKHILEILEYKHHQSSLHHFVLAFMAKLQDAKPET